MLVFIVAATNTIGSIPLFISIAKNPDAINELAANPSDLSPLGLDPNVALIFMLFPFIIGLIAFIILVKPLNQRSLLKVINGTSTFRWNRFFISAFVWIIISAIYLFANLKLDPSNFSLNSVSETLIPLVIISVLLIPFQTAFEEVIFRGYLMQGFAVLAKNRWIPLVMTSLLFALIHGPNPEVKEFGFFTMMPQYLFFGLIFGIITILDDGIEASMGAHAANNAFLCIMVTNKASALQTPALYEQHNFYPWIELATTLFMGVLIILILKYIFKWRSFSALIGKVEATNISDQMP